MSPQTMDSGLRRDFVSLQPPGPPWITEAVQWIGTREIPGSKHNDAILGWWRKLGIAIRDDETPYCAGFVGFCLEEAGYRSSKSAAARSYLKVGSKIPGPAYGSIAVFWRGSPSGWSGHVGFVVGKDPAGRLLILGANQKNMVRVDPFGTERLLGFRWPGVSPLAERWRLPLLDHSGPVSRNEA